MTTRIEYALQQLIGLPLWRIGRAMDMALFEFGEPHLRQPWFGRISAVEEVGEYALHVQCAWRIVDPERIVVASRDRFTPMGNPVEEPDDFDWMAPGTTLCDERVEALMATHAEAPLLVTTAVGDEYGGFSLSLSTGYTLHVFPDDSLPGEHWRFFKHDSDEEHFVVTGEGIES